MNSQEPLSPSGPKRPEVFDETVPHSAPELLGRALAELEALRQPEANAWPEVAVLTSNSQVEDREVRIVDARGSENPHYAVYMKLHNWSQLFQKAEQWQCKDSAFTFPAKNGRPTWSQLKIEARHISSGGADVALIYGKSVRTADGLVALTIPAGDESSEDPVTTIEDMVGALTGESFWDEEKAADSLRAWKTNRYRTFHKLGEGPLSPQETAAASQLEIQRISPNHFALVAPGQHRAFELEYAPGSPIIPKHEVKNVTAAVESIASGALLSNQRRLEGGLRRTGRSTDADALYGGGDLVYTYAASLEAAEGMFPSSTPRFVLRPETLDRIDVRAYETDAYGSTVSLTRSVLDEAIGREIVKYVVTGYEERLAPEEFGTLGGVHELCFEGAVPMSECQQLLLPTEEGGSFSDTDWGVALAPYVDPRRSRHYQKMIEDNWNSPEVVQAALRGAGLPEREITVLTAGMSLPLRERVLAKLHAQGIEEVNGRPVEEFVAYGKPFIPSAEKP